MFSLGDVGVMLVTIAVLPPLYLTIPTPVVAGILLLAVASSLHTLLNGILRCIALCGQLWRGPFG